MNKKKEASAGALEVIVAIALVLFVLIPALVALLAGVFLWVIRIMAWLKPLALWLGLLPLP